MLLPLTSLQPPGERTLRSRIAATTRHARLREKRDRSSEGGRKTDGALYHRRRTGNASPEYPLFGTSSFVALTMKYSFGTILVACVISLNIQEMRSISVTSTTTGSGGSGGASPSGTGGAGGGSSGTGLTKERSPVSHVVILAAEPALSAGNAGRSTQSMPFCEMNTLLSS